MATATAVDTWTTYDPENWESKFSPSLIARAKKRRVYQPANYPFNRFIVDGDARLDDCYDHYEVAFDGRLYHCSCRGHAYGNYRKLCSHALAVMLWRRANKNGSPRPTFPPEDGAADGGAGGADGVPVDSARATVEAAPLPTIPDDGLPGPRDEEWGFPPLPEWVTEFRPHQVAAVLEAVEAFESGERVVMCDAPTGCLSGETLIKVSRGGATKTITIRQLVHKFNGGRSPGNGHTWRLDISTLVQRCVVAPKWGSALRLVPVVNAVASGVKTTHTLTTRGGRSIRATADHGFMLNGGVMVPLGDLKPGDEILVDGGKGAAAEAQKQWYRVAQGLVNHPHRGEWPYRQPIHRLVVEADMSGLPLDWYIAILRDRDTDVSALKFLDPADAVHHINHNAQDNSIENLQVIPHIEHWRGHGLRGGWANVANRVVADVVESIVEYGEEETFDLTVLDEPHNYVANGFVVKNSGKTLIGEMVRRRLETRALYVCSTKSLQAQVLRDYPYARVLMGRANYPTLDHPKQFDETDAWGNRRLTAADCVKGLAELPACAECPANATGTRMHCQHCHFPSDCPYERAKQDALEADLAVLNTAYFLTEANAVGKFSGPGLVIVDEADLLEQELMGQVEVRVGQRLQKKLGLDGPTKKTVEESWVEWVGGQAIPKVEAALKKLPARTADIGKLRERMRLERLLGRLRLLDAELGEGRWVFTGYAEGEIAFRPVRVDHLGPKWLWKHAERWLLMSATLISAEEMAESLGLEGAA